MIAAAQAESRVRADGEGTKEILLVEDDAETQEAVATLLRDEGYEVLTSAHGQDALERLRDCPVDLIILDLKMPVMDGWQFRTIQRADPRLCEIPLIAVSADDSAQAAAIDADLYLKKPLKANELLLAVERVFLGRERERLAETLRSTERIALLGTIAASVGHEINNPLTYILGNLDLLRDEVAELGVDVDIQRRHPHLLNDIRAQLSDVRTGVERIRAVVRMLHSLSRPRLESRRVVDVSRVLDTSIAIALNEIRHRAQLETHIEKVPPLLGDDARLGQVFVNLLVNAAQAIPPGATESNRVVVTTAVHGDHIIVEVRDTGAGISPELHDRIFEPFFSTKDPSSGTGLGLAIARNIVEEHGGRIEVESAPGKGSVFRVLLPFSHPDALGAPPNPQVAGDPSTVHPMRVLVIDDDPLVLSAVERMLRAGNDVVPVAKAREALTQIERDRRYDVILCDLMMPEMTGMKFYDEVLRLDRTLASRIVFMTGGAFAPEARDFLRRARAVSIDKPFTRDDLLAALERARRQPSGDGDGSDGGAGPGGSTPSRVTKGPPS